MKVLSNLLIISLTITIGCLGAGYITAGYWLIVPILIVMLLFWIFTKNQPVFWPASSLMVVFIILAAVGMLADLPLMLMITAGTAALISWDLMQFNQSMVGNAARKTNMSLEKHHLNSLALAAFAGLALALISSYISLQFPFGQIVILVLLSVGCLIGAIQYIMKKKI
jgi:hypothetical protein